MQEIELINKLKNKDEDAFKIVFQDNLKKVFNTCYRIVNDKQTAEDLTQDVFIKVFLSINDFREESKLSTWIYKIAVSKSLDYIKAQKRKKRFAIVTDFFSDKKMKDDIPSAGKDNPERELDNKERIKILKEALDSLSENQRVAFSLSKYEEMSYNEIAEILDTSVSAVESLIHRAKKNLEKKLYNYYKKHL